MSTYDFNLITAFANSAPSNEIEPFPDYDRGLGIAFDQTDGKPEMKGLNGLFSLMTVSLLALKQRGILTWTTGFEYKQGAFVVEANRLYQAKIDNTSKQPSLSQNEWRVWASVSDIDVDTNGNIIKTAKVGGAFTLKVNDASTTVKGVVRAATATEVANKSNVNAYVTPKNVADMTVRTSRKVTLPDGTIMLWGATDFIGGSNTLHTSNFSEAFPNECYFVQIGTKTQSTTGVGAQKMAQYVSHTKSQFSWFSDQFQDNSLALISATYFAVGY